MDSKSPVTSSALQYFSSAFPDNPDRAKLKIPFRSLKDRVSEFHSHLLRSERHIISLRSHSLVSPCLYPYETKTISWKSQEVDVILTLMISHLSLSKSISAHSSCGLVLFICLLLLHTFRPSDQMHIFTCGKHLENTHNTLETT